MTYKTNSMGPESWGTPVFILHIQILHYSIVHIAFVV